MLNTNRVIQRYKLDSRFAKEIDKGILISMLLLIMFGILNIYLETNYMVFNFYGSSLHNINCRLQSYL